LIQAEKVDDEFLIARLLFLLTYETDLDFVQIVKDQGVADAILKVVFSVFALWLSPILANCFRTWNGIPMLLKSVENHTNKDQPMKTWLSRKH